MTDPVSAPQLAWRALGARAPEGATGTAYRREPVAPGAVCATCAGDFIAGPGIPAGTGVPVAPPGRGETGIDNPTFSGHAEFFRFGSHVCAACAWYYGDPKRTHRSVLAIGTRAWWPLLKAGDDPARPRWRKLLGEIGRAPPDTPMTGVLTTDPKIRLWPRMQIAVCGDPALYVHSPDHDWSRWTSFDLRILASTMQAVDAALTIGASRSSCWFGLLGQPGIADRRGEHAVLAIEERLAPLRPSGELLIACLTA